MRNQELDRSNEIDIVNPGHILAARTSRASKTVADEAQQSIEHTPVVGTHGHRAAKRHAPGTRQIGCEERAFPRGRYIDAELPLGRQVRFLSA